MAYECLLQHAPDVQQLPKHQYLQSLSDLVMQNEHHMKLHCPKKIILFSLMGSDKSALLSKTSPCDGHASTLLCQLFPQRPSRTEHPEQD